MKRIIIWEYLNLNPQVPEEETDFDEYEEEYPQSSPLPVNYPEMISPEIEFTPLGMFHSRDPMNPTSGFAFEPSDFFIGHTNFKLTQEDILELNKVKGLEFLNPYWTQYRFVASPGKAFDWRNVRTNIETALNATFEENFESLVVDLENKGVVLEKFILTDGALPNIVDILNTNFNYWVLTLNDDNSCLYYACIEDNLESFYEALKTCLDSDSPIKKTSESVKQNEYYNKAYSDTDRNV